MAGQRTPPPPPYPPPLYVSFSLAPQIFISFVSSPHHLHLVLRNPQPVWVQTGRCNCLETGFVFYFFLFCHLHVADNHFASLGALTLLYLPARNEIIRGGDEKLTSLLHLPVALSDGCHSNHYATEQTRWVKDGFECGSLGSRPGYDRADRPVRAAPCSPHNENSHIHFMSHTYKCCIESGNH